MDTTLPIPVPVSAPKFSAHFLLREAAGALGDLGTFVPLAVGMVQIAGLDAGTVLVTAGVANIVAGLAFRLPMAVQPMKAICALAIGGALTGPQAMVAGLFVGVGMAALAAFRAVRALARAVPGTVLRGVQLTVAGELLIRGVRFAFSISHLEIGMVGALLGVWLLRRRLEWVAIGLLGAGLFLAAWHQSGLLAVPPLSFWRPQLMNFDTAALQGIWRGGLPQVPLTLLNSVLAVSALAVQLYPNRATRVTVTRMALSVGLMNLFVCPLGGLPLCHGSGGLAGQHRLGARSGLSVVMLGGAKLTLGLCFSAAALAWMQAFPVNILGLFLVLAGLSLAEASRFWESRAGILVAAIMIAVHFSTGWLLAAFGAGWIVCLVVERKSTCPEPN